MSSHASTVNISALTDSIRKLSYQPSHNQITEQINKTQSATMALTEDPRTLQLALELTMVGLNDTTTNNSNSYSVQSIIINNNQNDYDINSAFTARTEMPIISNVSTESGLPMPTSTGLEDRSKKSQNMTECVPVPSSEHVAEIVGRQGCKIKALRAKTNTYIKTPVRGEEPVFVVTGRKEDVNKAKREILSAADHFSLIRASRKPSTDSADNGITGIISTAGNNAGQLANVVVRANQSGPPCLPGQITIHVRVPYRVVGLVVGPKGATIKHIQQETQTYIVTPSREKEPIFEVTGLPEHVETARKQIEAHIALRTGNNSSNGVGGGQGSENGTTDSLDSSEFVTLHTINTLSQILNDENSDILSSIYKGNDSYVVVDNNAQLKSNDSISNNHLTGNSININPLVHNSVVTSCFSSSEPLATASTATTTQIVNQVGSKTNTFRNPISNTKTLSFCPPSPSVVLSTSSSSTTHSVSASILTRSCSSASSTASTKSTNNSAHSTSNSVNTPPELLNVWKSLNDSIDIDEGIGDSPSIWSLPTGAIVTAASNCSPTASISPTDSLFAEHSLKISKTTNSSVEHRPQLQINSDKSLMQRECFVCNEKEVTTALVPCGHNMFCMDCANQICVSMESICPICHSIVYHAMRILA